MKRSLLISGLALSIALTAAPAKAHSGLTLSVGFGYPYYTSGYPYFYGYGALPSYPYYAYMPYYTPPDFTHQTYIYPPSEINIVAPSGPSDACRNVRTIINGSSVWGRVCPQFDGSWRFAP